MTHLLPKFLLACALAAMAAGQPASAAPKPAARPWVVQPRWVAAEEGFLAGDALQGRGSATRDEAIAAAYVAAQFESFGLTPAPGQAGFFQTADVVRPRLDGPATLSVDGRPVAGATLLMGAARGVSGPATLFTSPDVLAMPAADIVLAASPASPLTLGQTALSKHVKLLILRESLLTRGLDRIQGGHPEIAAYLAGTEPEGTAVATLPAEAFDRLAERMSKPGAAPQLAVTLDGLTREARVTTNAIGYLAGRDPKAGYVIVSAHLDHLGVTRGGVVMHGANDDASGMVGVIELARALAARKAAGHPLRRGVLFIGYGSEEIGKFGSTWFAAHPVVPLGEVAANIEFEMIGLQDPKLAKGSLFVTGSERSDLFAGLKTHGAPVSPDTHPDQHYFERSDNFPLAQAGVVAHTVAGWTTPPTYHQPTDTVANIDLPFLAGAIQAMIEPVAWLADSAFRPQWAPGGRPEK
ncbi:M28 family metallopeptidase [Phenylobacterium sp.]|jgi:hypothetical protein|uniref:M28 family metallopeptidase n=1 Tax=Phenylobacterium sp. TaxID=1871053 RepID=UPI002F3E60A4